MQTQCPHCSQTYDVTPQMLGMEVRCSSCQQAFNLPPAESAGAASESTDSNSPIEVACTHCDARFHAPPQLVGSQAQCPTCERPFIVERADTDITLAPAEDPFGSTDPFAAAGSSGVSPLAGGSSGGGLGGSGLGGSGWSGSTGRDSSGSDKSGLWIGVAKILGGGLLGVFGVVATIASYDSAQEGESYTVYTGLVIAGVGVAFYGIRDIYVFTQGD